jgi:hypothetical protein
MNDAPPFAGVPAGKDPRLETEFAPQFWPALAGTSTPPPDATDRDACIQLAFLAAYYHLNRAHARLREIRSEPVSPARHARELELLREVDRRLIARDQLEDDCAPFGLIVEPITQDGFAVELRIRFGHLAARNARGEDYTITALVPIPPPEGLRFGGLPIAVKRPPGPP